MADTPAAAIVWCDIPVRDLDRAIRFYAATLATKVEKVDVPGAASFAVLQHGEEGHGVGGCLVLCDDAKPTTDGALVYLNCQGRLDQAVAAVPGLGGKVLKAKHSIGPHGFRAVVIDSEGNRIGLHSM